MQTVTTFLKKPAADQLLYLETTFWLGISKKEDGDLNAHAWLRAGDIIILGGDGLERFAVVSTFA